MKVPNDRSKLKVLNAWLEEVSLAMIGRACLMFLVIFSTYACVSRIPSMLDKISDLALFQTESKLARIGTAYLWRDTFSALLGSSNVAQAAIQDQAVGGITHMGLRAFMAYVR